MIRDRIGSRHAIAVAASVAVALVVSGTAALAHHPMGGVTPGNVLHGFLSGIGHPLIGIDHFAFIVAVGIATALAGARLVVPAIFIVATVAGCLLSFAGGVAVPFAEIGIAASVLVLGGMIMSGRVIDERLYALVFGVAGLLHGGAYAAAIVGAEAAPLGGYLAGFALVQFAVIGLVVLMTRFAESASSGLSLKPRLAGAMIAGVGLTFMAEHGEKLLLPSV